MRTDDGREIAAGERDRRALDRDIGPGAHGDPHTGAGEGRSIVDAVASHRDLVALCNQPFHLAGLIFRPKTGMNLVDPADLARDGLGGQRVVSRQHRDPQASAAQIGDRFGRGGADRIGDRDETGEPAVKRDQNDPGAFLAQRGGRRAERCGLIIEDDTETAQFVSRGLSEIGHTVVHAADGRDGLFQATDGGFDAIVVDRMLPALDGLSLLKMLRAAGNVTPVLMLTALASLGDRVEGLENGADDYLVKPFAFSELSARVNALGRRPSAKVETSRLVVGDIELDFHRRTVFRNRRKIALQPREFALLAELMRNPHRVMTKTMLLERIWDFDFNPKTNILETHLSRLRSKLNAGFVDDAIETVRGAGYTIRCN